ncbi:MAG: flagellar export chaperone FliS [Thermogutta sp.]
MSASVGDSYREGEILTAPPQRLHLLLIEAAIRYTERIRQLWQQNQNDAAFEALLRAQQIVSEILAGIKITDEFPLARKVAAIYTFIYRSLVQAGFTREEKYLDDALRVLQIQRETWEEVCRRLGGTSSANDEIRISESSISSSSAGLVRSEPVAPHTRPPLTNLGPSDYPQEYATGFSWEA